jgi:putative ABC transport system permease protein
LILLVGAGLLLRSFAELWRVHTGGRAEQTLTAGLSLPNAHYPKREQVAAYVRQLTDRLRAIPGVRSAGLVSCLPVGGYCGDNSFRIEGRPLAPGQFIFALARGASPGYFAAAGIPLLEGRDLNDQDNVGFDDKHPHDSAVVVSQSMARKFWPNGDWVNGSCSATIQCPVYRVVGVVADVLIGLDDHLRPTMYTPLLEGNRTDFYAMIHTEADPVSITAAVRREIASLDPDNPAFEVRSMTGVLTESAARRKFTAFLLGLFAALAVALAAVGLYGVLSYAVAQRRAEIGIRVALGAERSQLHWLVLLEGMRPAILAMIGGLAGAAWLTKFMRALLFGVSANDHVTFIAVPLMLLAIALAACTIPAWRATRVDPVTALRSE